MAWLFAEVPGWVRLLLALAITVAITVFVVWRFHDRILALSNGDAWPPEPQKSDEESEPDGGLNTATSAARSAADGDQRGDRLDRADSGPLDGKADDDRDDDGKDDKGKDDGSGKPPKPFYLAGRIMAITTTAFVFLLAFTLNNFWGNAQDARVALEEEGGYYQSAVLAAAGLPDGPRKDAVLEALRGYGVAVVEQQWPLLEQANSVEALNLHRRLGAELAKVTVLAAPPAEVTNDPSWGAITTAVPDILDQGTQRIHQLPRPQAPGIIGLIFLLAILNLAVTAAYQPAPLVQNMVLMGLMAGIVALMLYILVETSNPFAGSGAVLPTPFLR